MRPFAGRLSQLTTVNGARALRAAPGDRGGEEAEDGARRTAHGEIAPKARVVEVEAAIGPAQVTLLGDRQRDDANAGIGEGVEQPAGLLGRDDHLAERSDHPQPAPRPVRQRERVEKSCGASASRVSGLRSEAAVTPQSSAPAPRQSSKTTAWWARWKAPTPRWTTPGRTARRS